MGRAPCCDKANVKKGPWAPEEDAKLKDFIEKNGTGGNWIALPQKAGLKRCGKSCRLRWLNYLRPNIKHGDFSDEEDRIICTLYATIGSRWSIIAAQLPGRTDNDIKNYWNTKLKKKLMGMMIFPPTNTNKRKSPLLFSSTSNTPTIFHPFQLPPPQQSLFSFCTPNSIRSPFSSNTTLESLSNSSSIQHPNFMFDNNNNNKIFSSAGPHTCDNFHQTLNQGFLNPIQYNTTTTITNDNNVSNLLMFGGITTEASGSSSSDGSCINQIELIKPEPEPLGNCFVSAPVSGGGAFFEDQIQTQNFFVNCSLPDEHHFLSDGHFANHASTTVATAIAADAVTVTTMNDSHHSNNNNNTNSNSHEQYDLEVVTQLVSGGGNGDESGNNNNNNDGFYLFNDESKTDHERAGMYYYYFN